MFLCAVAVVALVGVSIFALNARLDVWRGGGERLAKDSVRQEGHFFEVSGPSMVPTLFGESCSAVCDRCGRIAQVTAFIDRVLDRHRLCCICGGQLQELSHDMDDTLAAQRGAADIVMVNPLPQSQATPLQIGDTVAVNYQGKLRVKRIAALPGDLISVPSGRVCVNGVRLEDKIASAVKACTLPPSLLPIDRDHRQSTSRWTPLSPRSTWTRNPARQWVCAFDPENVDSASDWLIYHHRDVRAQGMVGEVMDDYQYNLNVTRRLVSVDRLAVSANTETASQALLEVAFWTSDGILVARSELGQPGTTCLRFHDAVPANLSESETPGLTAVMPVAIRLQNFGSNVRLCGLWVDRLIEYRLRPSDDASCYPLRINAGQVYVVGDNVPVSDDSRVWGALLLDDVVGRVEEVTSRQKTLQRK